jgi:hypothetical protein
MFGVLPVAPPNRNSRRRCGVGVSGTAISRTKEGTMRIARIRLWLASAAQLLHLASFRRVPEHRHQRHGQASAQAEPRVAPAPGQREGDDHRRPASVADDDAGALGLAGGGVAGDEPAGLTPARSQRAGPVSPQKRRAAPAHLAPRRPVARRVATGSGSWRRSRPARSGSRSGAGLPIDLLPCVDLTL